MHTQTRTYGSNVPLCKSGKKSFASSRAFSFLLKDMKKQKLESTYLSSKPPHKNKKINRTIFIVEFFNRTVKLI